MSKFSFGTYAVRDEAGDVDVDATVLKFQEELEEHVAQNEVSSEVLRSYIDEVLAANPGVGSAYVAAQVANKLDSNPANFSSNQRRVTLFISSQSKGDNSYYISSRGRNNEGLRRRADVAKAAAAPTAQAAQ